jgi:hypothetical protein
MIGDGMGGYDHLLAEIPWLRTVLLFQNQLEVPETVLARNQTAGIIHGEVLDPDRRIATRRDGPEPQGVGFAMGDAPRSHPAGFEGGRRQLADQRQFIRRQNFRRGRAIGNGTGSRQNIDQRCEQQSGEDGFHFSEAGLYAMSSLMTVPPNWLSCLKRPAW